MSKKLSFIEEAEFRGFNYRPAGILGNGFYGNGIFISLAEMEKYAKTYSSVLSGNTDEFNELINPEYFIECENKNDFYTIDIIQLFPDLKEHELHNFLNRFKDVFLSQKLFSINNRKRVFTKEAVKFIYNRLVKKESSAEKKRGRKAMNEAS
jgi:hypothetical protein